MLIFLVIFSILSLITLVIFLVENRRHRQFLKNSKNAYSLVGKACYPVIVTAVREGKMQESYMLSPDKKKKNALFCTPQKGAAPRRVEFRSGHSSK